MPDIVNPQAVRFCNERGRVMADEIDTMYMMARRFVDEWDANALDSIIPDSADVVVDGAAQDGRQPMTGSKARFLRRSCVALLAALDAAQPGDLSDTAPRITRIRRCSVNGRDRFGQ